MFQKLAYRLQLDYQRDLKKYRKRIKFLEDQLLTKSIQFDNLKKAVDKLLKKYDTAGIIAERNKRNAEKLANFIKPILGESEANSRKIKENKKNIEKKIKKINFKPRKYGKKL